MFAGSPQTRSTLWVTRSGTCWATAWEQGSKAAEAKAAAASATTLVRRSIAHAGRFIVLGGLGFVIMLFRANARQGAVGAGPQVHIDVVDVAHDVAVLAERRHHFLVAAADVFLALRHGCDEVLI